MAELVRAHVELPVSHVVALVRQVDAGAASRQPGPALPPLDAVALDPSGVLHVLEPPGSTEVMRVERAALVLRGLLPEPGTEGDGPDATRLRGVAHAALAPEVRGPHLPQAFRRALAAERTVPWGSIGPAIWSRWAESFDGRVALALAGPAADDNVVPEALGVDVEIIPLYPDDPLPWDGEGVGEQPREAVAAEAPVDLALVQVTGAGGAEPARAPSAQHESSGAGDVEDLPLLALQDPPRELTQDEGATGHDGASRQWAALAGAAAAAGFALALLGWPVWDRVGARAPGTAQAPATAQASATTQAPEREEARSGRTSVPANPQPETGEVPSAAAAQQTGQGTVQDERDGPGVEGARGPTPVAEPVPEGTVAREPRATETTSVPTVIEGPAHAAAPRPLEVGIEPTFSPSFAAAGSELYFHAEGDRDSRLMRAVVTADGTAEEVWRVLDDGARNYHPRVSPDGRYVAFDSDRTGTRGVHILDLQRGVAWRASGEGYAAAPAWSPDGRTLAFVRAEPGREKVWNLWALTPATGEMRRLTSHQRGQTWAASWLPDGRRICYSHEDRLIVLDLESGASTVFYSPRPGRMVRTPAVSPDGRRVVFQVHGDGAWLLDLERDTVRRLLPDRSAEEFAWSPDGARLAFHSHRGGTWRVWLLANPT